MKKGIKALAACVLAVMLAVSCAGLEVYAAGTDTVTISTADDLKAFAVRVNNGETSLNAELTKDIDMSMFEETYTPIGTSSKPYSGTFDGNGYEVQNLTISSSNEQDIGLFGIINGATIKNVGVDGKIIGRSRVGGIVGFVSGGNTTIKNCWNKATITATDGSAGGIVGYINNGNNTTIENCWNIEKVETTSANSNYAGGIAGRNDKASIINCYNVENVTANGSYAGGIAGYNDNGSITKCYNEGTITSSSSYAGGITGLNYNSSIMNCYNTGEIISTTYYAGGIAGYNYSGCSIMNCYNVGNVTANSSFAGGITGFNYGLIKNCYNGGNVSAADSYKGEISGYSFSDTGDSSKKTAVAFNSGEVTWLLNGRESDGVWKQTLGEDNYPNFTGLTVCYDETNKKYYNTAPKPSIAISNATASTVTIELDNYDGTKYGTVQYKIGNGDWNDVTLAENNSFIIENLQAVTEYIIYIRYTENENSNIAATSDTDIAELNITTKKYANSWKEDGEPNIGSWTYGNPKNPTGAATYGDVTFTYYTDKDCTIKTTSDNSGASEDGGQPVNAGTYYMIASVESGDTYEGLESDTIEFIISKASQNKPSLTGVAETIEGKMDGKISGLSTAMEYATTENASDSDYTKITAKDMTFASGTYYIRYAEKPNYNASPAAEVTIGEGRKLTVTVPENQTGYTLTVKDNALSYNGETTLSFSLKDGYSKTDGFSVKVNDKEITLDEDNTYTVSDVKEDVEISVTGVADITAPTGTIKVTENEWKKFLNEITFGLFFKKTQTVTITGEDAGSGIASICYYVTNKELSDTNIKADSIEWQNYENAFSINPSNKYIIYAKITDNAGNVTYISSKGIIIYTDAEQVTPELKYVKGQTDTNPTAKVNLKGNTVNSIGIKGVKGEDPDNGQINNDKYSVSKEADENGYSTITFDLEKCGSYFESLDSGDYTLTISYNPLGEEYKENLVEGKDTNDAPAATAITLKIRDQLTYDVQKPGLTYNGKAQKLLEVNVNGGTVSYGTDEENWSTDIPTGTDAGTYTVYYKIEADGTHSGSIDSTGAKVTIGRKEITIPTAKTGLTYTGKELTGVEAGTGYTLEGNTGIDAGNYTATATPDKNHRWEDSETPTDSVAVAWTIGKAEQSDISVNISDYVYGEDISAPSITGNVQENAEPTYYYRKAGSGGTATEWKEMTGTTLDAGTYEMYAVLKETANYESYTTDSASFIVKPKTIGIDWTNTKLTYNGKERQPDATVAGVVAGDTVDIDVSVEGEHKNAGTYTAIASITNTNYVLNETKEKSFEINPKELRVEGLTAVNRVYDGTTKVTLTGGALTGIVNRDDVSVTMPTEGTVDNANRGTGKTVTVAKPELTGSDKSNYQLADLPEIMVDIGYAVPSVTITNDISKTYDGNVVSDVESASNSTGTREVEYKPREADDSAYTTEKPKDAGEYTVRVTYSQDENYLSSSEVKDFAISKKTLTAAVEAKDKTYDGTTGAEITAGLDTGVEGETLTIAGLSGSFDDANAGEEKTVTIDASEIKYSGSADINNYDVKIPETTTANIKKADMSSDVSVTAKEAKTYRGTAYEIADLLEVEIPDNANIKYGTSETDCTNDTLSYTNAGAYRLYYTVSMNNYDDVTGVVDITIDPKTLTEDMIKLDSSENSYVFDGEKITPSVTVSDERDGANIITSGDYAVSGDTSGLAYGTYILTVTGQNNYKGAANITWNILDRNAPEGVIEIDGNKWRKLLKTITFGLFSKETKTVTITGADGENESGIGGMSYCAAEKPLIDADMTDAEILDVLSRAEWTELALKDGQGSFDIAPDAKLVIYAKIADKAGNITYISSDGVTLDATAPVITGVTDGAAYYTSQKVTVSDGNLDKVTVNGEKIDLENGQFTLRGNREGNYEIIAVDKAGNSVKVTVTMKKIAAIGEAIQDITPETVTSEDRDAIQEILDQVNQRLNDETLTGEERAALEELRDEAKSMLEKLEEIAAEMEEVREIIGGYDEETVTSKDKEALSETIDRIEALLESDNLTGEERAELEKLKEKAEALITAIKKKEAESGGNEKAGKDAEDKPERKSSSTGDDGMYGLYGMLALLSAGGCVLVVRKRKRQ